MADRQLEIQQEITAAYADKTPLEILGSGSKRWYGRKPAGKPLHLDGHTDIISYEPTELVMTARSGTRLSDIASALDEHGQRLGFDPPYFGEDATIGGTIACGFSGPRRPYAGSARDFTLGCRMVSGRGEVLRFGGEVMKNVAGFDVSRLLAGSLGTLGVLLDVSLKVLPHRIAEHTVVLEEGFYEAVRSMNHWAATPLPITAMASNGQRTFFRICGTPSSVQVTMQKLGGCILDDGLEFWKAVREHTLPFFQANTPLWRLSVPPAAAHPIVPSTADEDWFIGWGGAQRWLKTGLTPETIFAAAAKAGGHATLFRGGDRSGDVFTPLPKPLALLHQRLKSEFDPKDILNPGRMYRDL